jgi:hypothetical protein
LNVHRVSFRTASERGNAIVQADRISVFSDLTHGFSRLAASIGAPFRALSPALSQAMPLRFDSSFAK